MSITGTSAASSAADASGATEALAAYAAGLRYEAIPPAVTAKVKACVLDALGCMVFGATLPWTRIVADAVREEGGHPQASIIGSSDRASVSQAVLVNCTAGHAFELDDAHTRASMHAGAIAVATALAIAEWQDDIDGREFITGIVAGYETGFRVGMAGAGNLFKRGFHAAAVCGVFVAAATAARLLGLDKDRTQHAFGIAGSMASGLMAAQEGAMVKRLHPGQAARNGVSAVLLARRGFTGITNVLEAPFGGFFSAMTDRRDLAALTAGLGTEWQTLAVGFKPYATAGASHPALYLLDSLMRGHDLTAADIERIDVECTTHCRDHVGWSYVAQGVASAQMNLYFALSAMAVDRAAMIEQFDESRLSDPRLMDFMKRIAISTAPEFDAMGNAFRYATRLTVTAKGARLAQETLHRPGSPEAPLSPAQLTDKFQRLATCALDADTRKRIIAHVDKLDELAALEPLIACLRVRTE
jgi:2-methylcitrate dehydratase PrpD